MLQILYVPALDSPRSLSEEDVQGHFASCFLCIANKVRLNCVQNLSSIQSLLAASGRGEKTNRTVKIIFRVLCTFS